MEHERFDQGPVNRKRRGQQGQSKVSKVSLKKMRRHPSPFAVVVMSHAFCDLFLQENLTMGVTFPGRYSRWFDNDQHAECIPHCVESTWSRLSRKNGTECCRQSLSLIVSRRRTKAPFYINLTVLQFHFNRNILRNREECYFSVRGNLGGLSPHL